MSRKLLIGKNHDVISSLSWNTVVSQTFISGKFMSSLVYVRNCLPDRAQTVKYQPFKVGILCHQKNPVEPP